jgi:hypothetical protein
MKSERTVINPAPWLVNSRFACLRNSRDPPRAGFECSHRVSPIVPCARDAQMRTRPSRKEEEEAKFFKTRTQGTVGDSSPPARTPRLRFAITACIFGDDSLDALPAFTLLLRALGIQNMHSRVDSENHTVHPADLLDAAPTERVELLEYSVRVLRIERSPRAMSRAVMWVSLCVRIYPATATNRSLSSDSPSTFL